MRKLRTVAIVALSLATATSKRGAARVNEAGVAILKLRPRQPTLAFLKSLAAGVREELAVEFLHLDGPCRALGQGLLGR